MRHLPDINFWLALTSSQHAHHPSALAWFQALPAGSFCSFCRYSQLGFLRLSTNPKSNPLQTQTLSQAWAIFENACLDPRIEFVDEPAGLESPWRRWSSHLSFSPNIWGDSYLAAFAAAGAFELVTFDKGFAKFNGLNFRLLT